MPLFFDPTMVLLIPALLLSLYAQFKVKSTFNKFSSVPSKNRLTGVQVAEQLLAASHIRDVKVEAVPGNLTDHYDPRDRTVRLSEAVYGETSLAAIGVAAHEVGHAVQHNIGYAPLNVRTGIFPVVSFGSKLAMPLLMIGIFLSAGAEGGGIGLMMLYAGILLFSATVVFQLVTLPVEFNASSRALRLLQEQHILAESESDQAKKVLDAAALTYVAAAIASVLQLIRLLLIARRR